MLRIGLTGGIGSGKSTVAGLLAERGAVVVDADRVAREVVAPGTPGLAAIRKRFGAGVLTAEGALDRAALGTIVFADDESRRALEAITHPLIRERTRALMSAAPADAVVVHDIPLLVETRVAPSYHLVVVVDVADEERVRRLVHSRGMSEHDARARIAKQAGRERRLAVADVVIDNDGSPDALVPQVAALWQRLEEFESRLRAGEPFPAPTSPADPDPTWPAQAARLLARLEHHLGPLVGAGLTLDHVGPTALGVAAPDVLHLQVGLPARSDADRPDVLAALARLGHPRHAPAGPADVGRVHLSCDPARTTRVLLRRIDSTPWRTALLTKAWLQVDGTARQELGAAIRVAAGTTTDDGYPPGWWESVAPRADVWAAGAGWDPVGTRD